MRQAVAHAIGADVNDSPPVIEVETAPNPQLAVIWLHGLGADGHDFAPLVPELRLDGAPGVRFIFPHAPRIPVTVNNGYVMRAWYDIVSLGDSARHVDEAGVRASCETVCGLIARESARGLPPAKIVLGGFSQGGVIAYTAGLTHEVPLAGIVALSTYLPAPEQVKTGFREANRAVPIFAAHGLHDNVVPIFLGELARDAVRQLGCRVAWNTYPMAHSVCAEEVLVLREWLAARLSHTAKSGA